MKTIFNCFVLFFLSFRPGNIGAQVTLKNPQICHNSKNHFVCYNDGLYKIFFVDDKFSGFSTIDPEIKYTHKDKIFTITSTSNDSAVTIQLVGQSVILKYGSTQYIIDSVETMKLNLNNIVFDFAKPGVYYTIAFTVNNKRFYFDITTFYKNWSWNLMEKHDGSTFFLRYNGYKHDRVENINRQDDSLRYGVSIGTSFRSRKRIWLIEPSYFEETPKSHLITIFPDFIYWYNRFGKLRKKKSKGSILQCNCN